MHNTLKIVPIDFVSTPTGPVPRAPNFYASVLQFCRDQFGIEKNFIGFDRAWAAVDGDRIIGIVALKQIVDVQMFHVEEPQLGNRLESLNAMRASKMLLDRASGYLADIHANGETLVYVAPEVQGRWKEFLDAMNARPANRFSFEI